MSISSVSGQNNRIDVIDYIKAICAVFVVLNHSNLFDESRVIYLLFINMAVPVFMMISGYISASVTRKNTAFSKVKSFIRYTIPTAVAFSFWLICKLILKHDAVG